MRACICVCVCAGEREREGGGGVKQAKCFLNQEVSLLRCPCSTQAA